MKYSKTIIFKVSEEANQSLSKLAKKVNKTKSQIMRELIKRKLDDKKTNTLLEVIAMNQDILLSLSRVTANLNQMARRANNNLLVGKDEFFFVAQELKEATKQAQEIIRENNLYLKSLL